MSDLIVSKESAGVRLDQFVADKITDWSRSQLAKNIKGGLIKVNGVNSKVHYFLKEGDVVTVGELTVSEPILRQKPIVDLSDKVQLVAATADYLVVNKPAGMIVHYPTDKPGKDVIDRSPSLVDWLMAHYPQAGQVGDDPSRPGIVHRLDKSVSGLLVIALNQDSFDDLKRQFKKRLTKKHYIALVYGKIFKDEDVINFPLERSTSGKKMAAKPMGSVEGKRAITEFKIMERKVNYTLLDVNLKTGRTHQIRAHMAAYGTPIVGDMVYGTANTRRLDRKLKLDRLFLAAVYLGFTDLKGEFKEYSIELPAELAEVYKKLK